MQNNKFLLLTSSIGVFLLFAVAAVQEHFQKEWRHIQSRARSAGEPVAVHLRQIVNPSLRVADRCVSCHVGMAPGGQEVAGDRVLRAHKPVVHDPADFGCTVCHAGQGPATERKDAHGEVEFWPAPMLPAKYSYAGCGMCHVPGNIPSEDQYQEAVLAFERLDCRTCHRIDGRGGVLRPGNQGIEGPDLSRAGLAGYDEDWYRKHLEKFQKEQEGPWKNAFAPLTDYDRELISRFLSWQMAAPLLVEAKSTFHTTGCLGCHKVSGVGGDEGPDLSRAGERDPGQTDFTAVGGVRTLPNWITQHFGSPSSVVRNSLMPALALSTRQIELLTFYTLSLRRRPLPASYVPKDYLRTVRFGEREFSTDGRTLYAAFCSGCHGARGEGFRSLGMPPFPALTNPDFLALASDDFLKETVSRGRPGRRMAAWAEIAGGLKEQEIEKIVKFVRQTGGVAPEEDTRPARWVQADAENGRKIYSAACAGCHGPEGEGGEGPALNNLILLNSATDTFLTETIRRGRRGTLMRGFGAASPTRPALSEVEIENVVTFIRSWEQRGRP